MQVLLPALLLSPHKHTIIYVTNTCSHLTAPGHGVPGFSISALASNRLIEMATDSVWVNEWTRR